MNSLTMSKNAHLHVDMSICPRRHPGHGPRRAHTHRLPGYVAGRPAQRPL